MARAAIAVMAKAPVPGLAKTRLIPALGAQGAARLAEAMLCHAVQQAVRARLGPVMLWTTPDARHPLFARLQQQHGLRLAQQQGTDLGARMAAVFALTHAASHDFESLPVLLMGTDLPGIDASMLQVAAARLADHDAVFVPARDGGYGLVGLSPAAAARPGTLAALFEGMRWSTPQVMVQTRARLAQAGLRHTELPAVADIDMPEDLVHLPPDWTVGRSLEG